MNIFFLWGRGGIILPALVSVDERVVCICTEGSSVNAFICPSLSISDQFGNHLSASRIFQSDHFNMFDKNYLITNFSLRCRGEEKASVAPKRNVQSWKETNLPFCSFLLECKGVSLTIAVL